MVSSVLFKELTSRLTSDRNDEPKPIQKYFSPEQQEAAKAGVPVLFRDLQLTPVGAF